MGRVDANDDTITRYVVRHHRYDPGRREWRQVVEAAFDNEEEYLTYVNSADSALTSCQAAGEASLRESYGGVVKQPGDDARARAVRLEIRRSEAANRARLKGEADGLG